MTPFSKYHTKEDIIGLLNDDKDLVFPICDNLVFIFKKMLDPYDDKFVCCKKEDAPILGLFHKLVRFFSHYIDSYKANNADLCMLLNRIIYEAYIKMRYLIDNPCDLKEYRALAFKPHLKILDDIQLNNTPPTKVFREKFEKAFSIEDLSREDIVNARNNPGGKNFRQMQELYDDGLYVPMYGMLSDPIHSGWNEIRQMYLQYNEEADLFFVDINYTPVLHYRALISIAEILISASRQYYNWISQRYPGHVANFFFVIDDLQRVCDLILGVVLDTYDTNPNEFLYK